MGPSFLVPDTDRIALTSAKLPSPATDDRLDLIIKDLSRENDPSSIDYQKLLLHIDQPYATELLDRLATTDPLSVLSAANEFPKAAKEAQQQLLIQAVSYLDADEKVTFFSFYENLPNAEDIRREATEEVIRTDPVTILEYPSTFSDTENFEALYIDCYNRCTPVERAAIFSTDAAEGIPNIDAMYKETLPVALLNDRSAIGMPAEHWAQQSWFKEIEFDFNQFANHADPKVGVAAIEFLQQAGVEVPEEALLTISRRAATIEPLSIVKLLDISQIEASSAHPFSIQALDTLTKTEPITALKSLNIGLGKDLTQEERKHFVTQAVEIALIESPARLLRYLRDFPNSESFSDAERADLQKRAILQAKQSDAESFISDAAYYAVAENDDNLFFETALSLAKSNPKALLEEGSYFNGRPIADQHLPLAISIETLAEKDPQAVLDFRNSNKTLEIVPRLFELKATKEALIKGCLEQSPTTLFENFYLLRDNPNRDALLLEAASKMSITDRLRYTGLTECDKPPTAEQQKQILANVKAIEAWISNPHFPDYSSVYEDEGLIRALRIPPSSVEKFVSNPEAQNDLRLMIGRNLYFQSKEISAQTVDSEIKNIDKLREQYGELPLFKNRNVLLVSGNELKPDGTLRFAQDNFVQKLRTESANFEHIMPTVGTTSVVQEHNAILEKIRTYPEPLTLLLNGHGESTGFSLANGSIVEISPYELAKAFAARATDKAPLGQNSASQPDIVIFNHCFGQDFVRLFYSHFPEGSSMPIAIGQAEVGQFGYSDFESSFGDRFLEKVIGMDQLEESQKDDTIFDLLLQKVVGEDQSTKFTPTINTVIERQYEYPNGNSFVYAPAKTAPFLQIGALETLKLPEVSRQA